MSDLERIGVSLDKALLNKFDELIADQSYPNRSEAIRDLIRRRLNDADLARPAARAVAGIFLVYDHHLPGLAQKLTEMQHQHILQVISSTHIHLDHHICLEIIIARGKVRDVKNLADQMSSLKGVKLSRLNLMTAGEKLV